MNWWKTLWFFRQQFPKFMWNEYFVWHAVDIRALLPSITVQRNKKLIRIVLGFWTPIWPYVEKGTLFSSKKLPSFHTVPFLRKIRKILKLFCNFRWWYKWTDERNWIHKTSFPLWIKNGEKSSEHYFVSRMKRTELIGPFSLGVQKSL